MAIFLSACETNKQRIQKAAAQKANAEAVGPALDLLKTERAQANNLPMLPIDCKRLERSGVAEGDRLDVALVKTDKALTRANGRVGRCADWHANLRKGLRQ